MTAPSPQQAEAYDAGRAAFTAGKDSTVCPHPLDSELRLLWVRGFVYARRDTRLAELAAGE